MIVDTFTFCLEIYADSAARRIGGAPEKFGTLKEIKDEEKPNSIEILSPA